MCGLPRPPAVSRCSARATRGRRPQRAALWGLPSGLARGGSIAEHVRPRARCGRPQSPTSWAAHINHYVPAPRFLPWRSVARTGERARPAGPGACRARACSGTSSRMLAFADARPKEARSAATARPGAYPGRPARRRLLAAPARGVPSPGPSGPVSAHLTCAAGRALPSARTPELNFRLPVPRHLRPRSHWHLTLSPANRGRRHLRSHSASVPPSLDLLPSGSTQKARPRRLRHARLRLS